jgi:phosphohistidine phosphatase
MKTLYLLRHAKSDWNDYSVDDHDRILNSRGQQNAAQMGRYLTDQNIQPDIIYCSTAKRTRETLSLVLSENTFTCPIEYIPDIYEANTSTLLSIIRNSPDKYSNIMMVGHNPGMQFLGLTLTENNPSICRQQLEKHLPTGTLQTIELNIECFSDARSGSGTLTGFTRPKILPNET